MRAPTTRQLLFRIDLQLALLLFVTKQMLQITYRLPEKIKMALDPVVQAAVDEIDEAITAEGDEIKALVQAAIDAIRAGNDPAEVVSALGAIKARVSSLSDTVIPAP